MRNPRFLFALDILTGIATAFLTVIWTMSALHGNKSDYFFAALAALATVLTIARLLQRKTVYGNGRNAN